METSPRVDALVRAIPRTDDEIRGRMPQPFRRLPLGEVFGQRYVPPIADIHPTLAADRAKYGDPAYVKDKLFSGGNLDAAILVCPNRLLRADRRHEVAVMKATNEWLAETWLDTDSEGKVWGSIYVSPSNVDASVREIEHWGGHPKFVQVAVPLHVHMPYGEEEYFPIWEAAAAQKLPVAIHGDGGGGVEFDATIAGPVTHFLEYHTLFPVNAMVHLTSLISEGVLDRIPELQVIFTDGAVGVLIPFLWREDAKLKSLKEEVPWVRRPPSDTIGTQVRFVLRSDDVPAQPLGLGPILNLKGAASALLYGSNFPMWDMMSPPADALELDSHRNEVMGLNALDTFSRLRDSFAGR